MKKGGTRVVSAKKSTQEPKESWRKWILTLLALGFALLVITMLSQQNKLLSQTIELTTAPENTNTPVAGSEHEAGNFETIVEESFSASNGKNRKFVHQCKGTIKTIVPVQGGYLSESTVTSYCVGTNQLVYVNTLGQEQVLSETTSTSANDAPMLLEITHIRGTENKNTYLISYGVIPCSYTKDACEVGLAQNYVSMAFDSATETARTLDSYPTFGDAIWNNSGTKAIFSAVQVGGAGCDEDGIVGYDLTTDTVTAFTDRMACAEETLGSSTDVEGNPLPAWGPVVWTSDSTFTATILEIDNTWTTIEGTF